MNQLQQILHNPILLSAISGWLIAQIIKTFIHLYFTKSFVPERLVGSGGMPSAHSATVCALATSSVLVCGCGSPVFAIAAILAIVVMYDAIGVRRETGIQAKVINEMIAIFEDMNKELSVEDKLKELVGHTPLQVLVGGILGIIVAFATVNILI